MSTLSFGAHEIKVQDGETVLDCLLRAGIPVASGCRSGACQSCLLRSPGPVPTASQAGLDESLIERGYFLACQAKASEISAAEPPGTEAFPTHQVTLIAKHHLLEDVLIVEFGSDNFSSPAGRFVRLRHHSGVVRPYSLATRAQPPHHRFQLHVRVIPGGIMSEILIEAKVGDHFTIEGPLGKCQYRATNPTSPILLIGSGTGLAPLYGVLCDALESGHTGPIHLYHGAASSDRLYFREELRALTEKFSTFSYTPCADQDVWPGDRTGSPLTRALTDYPDLAGTRVFLCGHPNLVALGRKKCFLAGASLKDIFADSFVAS